jgi:hypothetical protein
MLDSLKFEGFGCVVRISQQVHGFMPTFRVQFHSDTYRLMLLQILPNSWKIDPQVNTDLGEDIGPTDA